MSSSIPIPPQASGSSHHRKPRHHHNLRSMDSPATSSEMSPSISASSSSSSTASPPSLYSVATPPSRSAKGKEPMTPLSQMAHMPQMSPSGPEATPTRKQHQMHRRRPSLLSPAILHQEAHVIDIGDPDGAPRLISYLSRSQGFLWNPEIFVPSYIDYDYTPLEHFREPIIEIYLSDKDIQKIYPE